MRLSIVLAICFLGVASASSLGRLNNSNLSKRDISEDLQKLAEAGKEKVQAALKQLQDLFEQFKNQGNHESTTESTITKRATNPLVLINDIGNPAKMAEDLVKVLLDMATGQGKRKRDISEDLQKLAEAGKEKAQAAFKQLQDLFEQFKGQFNHNDATTVASVESSSKSTITKRDVSEDLKKLAEAGKEKAQAAFKQLQDLFEQFKGQFNHNDAATTESSTVSTVAKRDIAEDLKLLAEAGKEKAQAALKQLQDLFEQFKGQFNHNDAATTESSTASTVAKRDITEDLKSLAEAGKEKAQAALKQLQDFFEQFKGQFNHNDAATTESSTAPTVAKRDITEDLKLLAEAGKEKIQAALKQLQSLLEQFKNQANPESEGKTVSKRYTNPLELINDLGDPIKFAQDLAKVLADIAMLQG